MKLRKLERPLYHGTSCSNIPDILSIGLISTSGPVHIETYIPDKVDERAFDYGVYITEDLGTSVLYAYDASKECPPELLDVCDYDPEKMCIVQVLCLPFDMKIGPDGYGGLMTNGDIPPECLSIIYPKDIKDKYDIDIWSIF